MSGESGKKTERPKTVLITGCTPGGIGSALMNEFWSSYGPNAGRYNVFCTLRDMNCYYPATHPIQLKNLNWVPLDVTDQDSIDECLRLFKEKSGGDELDILINNAGKGYSMPLLDSDLNQARKIFDVNYFGALAVTQAFAPLIIKAKGRIVNISSVAQFAPVPWIGVYNSSKAALGMFSDTLRLEMAPFGVKVINVVTGGVESKMNDNNIKGVIAEGSFYAPSKDIIERMIAGETSLKHQSDQEAYAKKVVKHITSSNPSAQFFAGKQSTSLWLLDTFTWHTIWDWVMPGMTGLRELKAKRIPIEQVEKEERERLEREREVAAEAAAIEAAKEAKRKAFPPLRYVLTQAEPHSEEDA
ncbi:related to short-chain dehydrogenase/reductase [Phialocephala subalpina]|uniref:Related to short-chain dehydrogenase/reductase n=1 Tax=Phialocephala subalpina TaxID=576137 RepID=A0A1L7XTI8_9HELO|nr:related to short-chain dehydrogenase/reductase [Phialocephala subalpina]